MKLERTIIIPSEDITIAIDLFKSLVYEEDVLLLVVLGNDKNAREAVKRADLRAQAELEGFKRKVAWVLSKDLFKATLFKEVDFFVENPNFSLERIDEIVVLSISPDDAIKDVIKTDEKIGFLRVVKPS